MWGRPNSIAIIDSSVHTAAEVEFGNFLTMMYFENTSATIKNVHSFPIEQICCQCVPQERGQFLGSAYEWLRLYILLADYTLLYELLDVVGHLGPKYSVPCPKEASLLSLVSLMYDWSISGFISLGTMILFPQVMSPDLMDSISLCDQNS